MTVLLDMNLSPRWKTYLEAHGFAAVHWSSLGQASAPDRDLMGVAAAKHYIVLTQDLDFGIALVLSERRWPSVIQLRSADLAPEVIGPQVLSALVKLAAELEQGALVTVHPERTRVRLLPMRGER